MPKIISFMVALFFCSNLVIADNSAYSIVNYKSSNNNFLLNAPDDLAIYQNVYFKEKPGSLVYSSNNAKFFNFMILNKNVFLVKNDVYKSIEKMFNSFYKNNSYTPIREYLLENTHDKSPSGIRYLLKYNKSNPKHWMHVVIMNGKNFFYVIQIRDVNDTLPKWFYFSACEENKCEKSKNQRTLYVPLDYK